MSFYELIKQRRSTRKFANKSIEPEKIETLKRGVLMSPASKRSNPWEFVFVADKEMLQVLAECKESGAKLIDGAELAVVVCADTSKSDVWIEDCSIASIYLQLLAEDLGLGSCWVQIRNRKRADGEMATDYVKRQLNIPVEREVLSIIAIGYKESENKPFDESRLQLDKIFDEKH